MMRPTPPSTSWRRSISRITSLAETQSGSSPVSLTPQISGILVYSGSPAMAMATSRPPAPIASMPMRTGRRRVAVRAQQGLARLAEVLHVHGVRDAVAGAREVHAEALAGALQEQVIVRVLEVFLDQVVVDVLRGQLGLDPIQAHRLQLQHHQRAGGVLGQGLVDASGRFPRPASSSPSTRWSRMSLRATFSAMRRPPACGGIGAVRSRRRPTSIRGATPKLR